MGIRDMNRYLFTVYLSGYGNNEDEAWRDAIKDIVLDEDWIPDKDDWRIIDDGEDDDE
jgi:hypothetical protein